MSSTYGLTQRTRTGTLVKTRVTFRVDDALYGTNSIVKVFDCLGGEADGIGMAVEGMPTFAVGDRRVVFARRRSSINPIVGFMQGLLRVRRDNNGVERLSESSAITLADLRSRIVSALADDWDAVAEAALNSWNRSATCSVWDIRTITARS